MPRAKPPQVRAGQIRGNKYGRVLIGHETAGKHQLWTWTHGSDPLLGIWESRRARAPATIAKRYPNVVSEGNAIPTTPRAQDWHAEHDARQARADELAGERNALAAQLAGLLPPTEPRQTQDMKTCIAKGPGWACDRDPTAAHGLCPGHYAQQRKDKPFAKLRLAHGQFDAPMTGREIIVPQEWDDLLVAEAGGPDGNVSDAYRRALQPAIERLKKAKRG